MVKSEKISDSYQIKRFLSSNEQELVEALKIYNDVVAPETKTDVKEITCFIDISNTSLREMYFLDCTIILKSLDIFNVVI